jgi:hypothetical protein
MKYAGANQVYLAIGMATKLVGNQLGGQVLEQNKLTVVKHQWQYCGKPRIPIPHLPIPCLHMPLAHVDGQESHVCLCVQIGHDSPHVMNGNMPVLQLDGGSSRY